MMYRKAVAFVAGTAIVATLSGCASWGGRIAEEIDAAVASSGLLDMGEIVCDNKRPSQLWGGSTLRDIGIGGSSNGQSILDQLKEAGFEPKDPSDELDDGSVSLFKDGVNFFVQIEPESGRSYAFGNCTTPEGGAVTINVSA